MSDPKSLSDQTPVEQLLARYKTFRRDIYPEHRELFESLEKRQEPCVLFITCSDSRIVPDLIMQSDPGDLFVCRNAGNIVPAYGEMTGGVSATVEYAVAVLKVKAIVVCGHSDCGAMKALLHPESIAELPTVKVWLRHSERALRIVRDHYPAADPDSVMEALIEENVVAQIDHLETHPHVSSQLRRGELAIYGWVYKIKTGEIVALDREQGKFVPLGDTMPVASQPPRRLIR